MDKPSSKSKRLERRIEGRKDGDRIGRFPCFVIRGGVQSSAMLLMACLGEITPKPDMVVFSDTHWEPDATYNYIRWISEEVKKYGIEVVITDNGNIKEDIEKSISDAKRFASLPFYTLDKDGNKGMVRRQCTNEYKIVPVQRAVRNRLGYKPRRRVKERVFMWRGISTDEIERVKPSQTKWIINRHPLVEKEMSRLDCMNWLEKHGFPVPPKSSCIGCPFHDDRYWLNMKRNDPKAWEDAVHIDKVIKQLPRFRGKAFLHRSCVPLDEVELNENQIEFDFDGFGNECTGSCGV